MTAVRFDDDEQQFFNDNSVSPFAKVLYFNMRARMDFDTGVVGMPPHVLSYKWLGWCIDYKPPAGSHESPRLHTRQMIRSLLSVLKRRGLLVPVMRDGKALDLVFKLPKAVVGLVRAEEQQQGSNKGGKTPQAPVFNGAEGDSCNKAATGELQHISGYQVNTTTTPIISARGFVEPLPLPDSFLPTADVIDDVVRLGVDRKDIAIHLFEFKKYYDESRDVSKAWNKKFYDWCKRELSRAA